MGIKDRVENSIIYWIAGTAMVVGAATWAMCQALYVAPRTEEIAQLKQKIAELSQKIKEQDEILAPYRSELKRLRDSNQKLGGDLTQSQENLKEWQDVLPKWQEANKALERKINLYAANCSIFENIKGLQSRKDWVEGRVEAANNTNSSEHIRLEDYRRVASEYHARISHLQEKLSCDR